MDAPRWAAPMESTGGPEGQLAYSCRTMSRCSQQPPGESGLQAPLTVAAVEPPQPSSYIQ